MASEGMSMLSCIFKQGNPFGIKDSDRSLGSYFTILANGVGGVMRTEEIKRIEGIFRDVTRKHLSTQRTCRKQKDAFLRIEAELRERIPGIFSGPPFKVEKMLLVAYRAVLYLHSMTRTRFAQQENRRTSLPSKHPNVLDLTQDSDSDASYKDSGGQDTDGELDVGGGGVERRKSLRLHAAKIVVRTVETPPQGVHRAEPQVSQPNSQQSSLPTATSTAMSGPEINRARAQWPLRYPYISKAATTWNPSQVRNQENISPTGIVAGSSGSGNTASKSVHRHREPLPDAGNLRAPNGPAPFTTGPRSHLIEEEEEDPIIILSSPPKTTLNNRSSQSGARKLPRPVPKGVITTEPSTQTPGSTSSQSPTPTVTIIEKFLQACQPRMDHLLPLFQKSGCVTVAYLRSIAKRCPQEREAILRKILFPPGREEAAVLVGDIDIWMLDLHLADYDFGNAV